MKNTLLPVDLRRWKTPLLFSLKAPNNIYQPRSERLPGEQGLTFMFHAQNQNRLSRSALQAFPVTTRTLTELNSEL